MSDEAPRRVAQLPGFDTAPDVYETPDLDDSATSHSTVRTSPREPSETSDTSDEDAEDDRGFGVSRRRLYPERARNRFGTQARGVDAKGTDLSDRVDGKRRGLRIRKGVEEEDEGLEARIARLKREVEECRALAKETQQQEEDGADGDAVEEVDALSTLLASIDVPSTAAKTARRRPRPVSGDGQVFHDALPIAPGDTHGGDEEQVDEHTLSRIAAFDGRLAALEAALGISSVLDPSTGTDIISTPLLPTLTLLDQQLSTLTSASSLANLEAASSRIAKLKLEAQQLSHLHAGTTAARPPTRTDTPSASASDVHSEGGEEDDQDLTTSTAAAAAAPLAPEDAQRLESLYTLLPTLQSLSPAVPALVTRLRSLRTLHVTAATAASDLDALEQRQGELDRELTMWTEGLERVERAVKEADAANGRNGNFVKSWVEELEGRVQALGR